jgi:large subunit ribosomal protein LP0
MPLSKERKSEYIDRLLSLLDSYDRCFIVGIDNVSSNQIHQMRAALRGVGEICMGKNTLIRKIFSMYLEQNPGHPYGSILPLIRGNVGFIFTDAEMKVVGDLIDSNRVPAPARVGAIAPVDVIIPPGPTGCDPGQTNFFQTLQIPTKIQKGQIEITTAVHILSVGDKVGSSEAVLLQKLDIRPFTYGMEVQYVYDKGILLDAAVLKIDDSVLTAKLSQALRYINGLSMAIHYPTLTSAPHSLHRAFKTLVSLVVEGCTDFSFAEAEPYKEYLKDPSKFAMSAPSAGGDSAVAVVEEEEEEEEEMDLGGGMDMFGGEGGDY